MLTPKLFLENLPHQPGVYQMLGEKGEILYVGKARNLKKRLSSYFSGKQQDIKTAALLKHVQDIDITTTQNENEALLLECNLIKKHKPHYNVLFRDDKSYPYILITTEHSFPKIDIYRGTRKRAGMLFGPYPNATAVRETINLIEKLFQLRTCSEHFFASRKRPCLQFQIGRCSGSCAGLISAEEYRHQVELAILFLQGKNQQIIDDLNSQMEKASIALDFETAAMIRDQIARLRQIQAKQYVSSAYGDADVIGFATKAGVVCMQLFVVRGGRILGSRSYFPSVPPNSSKEEVLSSFVTQHYLVTNQIVDVPKEIILNFDLPESDWIVNALNSQAQHKVHFTHRVRGERKKWLTMANNSAQQSLISHLLNKANTLERFEALKKVLEWAEIPERIECFDISHSMGEATVGACVVFNKQGPIKNEYRRFNINHITPGDDVAAMRQTLERRYKRLQQEEAVLPDIILIDGGKTQLNTAYRVLKTLNLENILLIGVAKGITRKPGFETLHFMDRPELHLSPDSFALHLIQQIRDEAHRFAVMGHRMRRDKARRVSSLESIPGIGAKRRRDLLRYFGGIQAINHASLEELAKVPGISQLLAERIFAALHNVVV